MCAGIISLFFYMQFNDTTNLNGLIQQCEELSGKGNAAISGNATELKRWTNRINRAYHKVVDTILDAQDGWDFDDPNHTDFPVLEFNLAADRRDYNIDLSEKVLKFKRLDIAYDGTNWYKAEPLDINEIGVGMGNDSTIDGRFAKNKPFYDLKAGNSIWIYPRADSADVSAGAKARVEWSREVDEFTTADTTQEPGIVETYHPMLAYGAVAEWAIGKDKDRFNIASNAWADLEARLRRFYGHKQEDKAHTLKSAFIDME